MSGQNASTDAAWYPDPLRRHEMRYWDGHAWTQHVADGGRASVDPVPSANGVNADEHHVNRADTDQQPPGPDWIVSPDTEIVGVRKLTPPGSVLMVVKKCQWGDVPARSRGVWEGALVEGEVPQICSWAGLLVTDRALLIADKFPAHHLGTRELVESWEYPGKKADRYDLTEIADVDENGFTYRGTRKKLKWKRGDEAVVDDGFLWLFLRQHPGLAPRLVLQESEKQDPAARRVGVVIGHLASAHSSFTSFDRTTHLNAEYMNRAIEVTLRDPSRSIDDYYQFVQCPFCGEYLRLRAHGQDLLLCNPGHQGAPGGVYATSVQVHRLARS